MSNIIGPYLNQDLYLTSKFHSEFVDTHVLTGTNLRQPFRRQIDLWWTALTVGVALDQRQRMPDAKALTKFHTGQIFHAEQWRVTHLELLALADQGEEDIRDPAGVIRLGHEYAFAGLDWLTAELRGSAHPTLDLMTAFEELLPSNPQEE